MSRLRDRRAKNVQTTYVDALPGGAAELFIKAPRILPRELCHAANVEQLEIAEHRGTYGDEVPKAAGFVGHKNLLDLRNGIP